MDPHAVFYGKVVHKTSQIFGLERNRVLQVQTLARTLRFLGLSAWERSKNLCSTPQLLAGHAYLSLFSAYVMNREL